MVLFLDPPGFTFQVLHPALSLISSVASNELSLMSTVDMEYFSRTSPDATSESRGGTSCTRGLDSGPRPVVYIPFPVPFSERCTRLVHSLIHKLREAGWSLAVGQT
jgi:hypothetical protein